MFFITTAAIAGTMTTGAWLIDDGPVPAALAAAASGAACAAVAAALVAWLDRLAAGTRSDAPGAPAAETAPLLPRRRGAGRRLPRRIHHHRPGRHGGRRFASAL